MSNHILQYVGNRMSLRPAKEFVYRNQFRLRRFQQFLLMVDSVLASKGSCRIIDVGGRLDHWMVFGDLLGDRQVHVSLVNLEAETTTDSRFESLVGDACDLSQFPNNAFDLVYSNSVIEHVGNWSNQRRMAAEIRRIAPRHFVQTPNFWFPIEPHFRLPIIHWLPEPWRVAIVRSRSCGFYQRATDVSEARVILDDARLLDAPAMAALFPDSAIERERFLLTKSLIAIR